MVARRQTLRAARCAASRFAPGRAPASLELVDPSRFARALALIDQANAGDPHMILHDGSARPKEQVHAGMMSEWVRRLRPEASEELLLAVRAHHIRRWELPRAGYPDGRHGYLAWRTELRNRHARELRQILETCGYDEPFVARACAILSKQGIARDQEVRTFEDALCLVFLETQFSGMAARLDRAKMLGVLRKSISKMSAEGIAAAMALPLPGHLRSLLLEAAGVG